MNRVQEQELVDQGALPPSDFHDYIERIREVASYDLEVPTDLEARLASAASDLLISPELLAAAGTAIQAGHLVLQGPPGTGKSSLARALCRAFQAVIFPVTAHENWSTFEVIGRQELRVDAAGREEIVPVNGFFTEAIIECAGAIVRRFDNPSEPQAVWLLIDELNRAHLDKAFGELFTVLGTTESVPVSLHYQREGNRQLVTPSRFRIIATLNSVDRQFVNTLGQGLKRRFTFLTQDIPDQKATAEPWGNPAETSSLASREFTVVLTQAASRVARRRSRSATQHEEMKAQLVDQLESQNRDAIVALFALAEMVRYSPKGTALPYLPIGTAQLIDTVELFLSRLLTQSSIPIDPMGAIDWAASVKIAPLFDADTISPLDLEQFATTLLKAPFDREMRRELLRIVAAGMYYVQ